MKDNNCIIEEMAECCPYFWNGACTVDDAKPTDCDLMCKMFGFITSLVHAGYRKQEWISVEERLPDDCDYVFISGKCGEETVVDMAYVCHETNLDGTEEGISWMVTNDWDEGQGFEITHWMPLPMPPKGDD